MKAIIQPRYGSPDVLRLVEVRTPVPQANEVKVRVRATSVSAAEMALRQGDPFLTRLFMGLRRPKAAIPGSELAGEIVDAGSDVREFAAGDRVVAATGAALGAHAEYVCLPENGALARIPASVSFEDAVAVAESGLTALPFLRDTGKIAAGQRVLINGASGAVGAAAVQLAAHFGAEVTGVCGPRHLDAVGALGAVQVIDYTTTDFTQTGATYDLIFDAVGKSSFRRCQAALAPDGIYLTTVPGPAILPQMLWTSRFGRRRAAIAFTGLRAPGEKARDLEFLMNLLAAGAIRPVVDRRYPLREMADAHRYVEGGHKLGSVVVTL